ncbi:unnamed protein product, partial [Ectocarpus sp. 12 AP-2014]
RRALCVHHPSHICPLGSGVDDVNFLASEEWIHGQCPPDNSGDTVRLDSTQQAPQDATFAIHNASLFYHYQSCLEITDKTPQRLRYWHPRPTTVRIIHTLKYFNFI